MRVKLLIFLAVWKRPEITEICFMGINRLRAGRFPIQAFAVISEESMIPLCKKYDIDYVMYKNEPLGEKKNFGLREAMKKDFDYLIEIGSDDLLKNEYLDLFPWTDAVYGLLDFSILNSETGECRKHSHRDANYALGRAVRKDVLEKVKMWPDKYTSGLDNVSSLALAQVGGMPKRVKVENPVAVDIKSEVNIWPYNYLMGSEYDLNKVLEGLSEQEKDAICLLINKKSESLIVA